MKKALLALVFISLILPMTCLATEEDPVADLIAIIERIQGVISTILFILAGLFILIAGFLYVTAAGDPNMIGRAKQMLIYAVIGIVIGVLAHLIVDLVEYLVRPPT